jgi:hydroxylamine reductase
LAIYNRKSVSLTNCLLSSLLQLFDQLAKEQPNNSLILTLGCTKNQFIHSEKLLGATLSNRVPGIMNMDPCNHSYLAVVVATKLAKALDCTINDLPLSLA